MIVYAHRSFPLDVPSFLHQFTKRLDTIAPAPTHDSVVELLVDFAEVEAAVTDAAMPECDDEDPGLETWRVAAHDLATAVCASWRSDRDLTENALSRCRVSVAQLARRSSPKSVRAKTAEGFAYHALYPEQYIAAATRMLAELSPDSMVCIGLRSIGSILAQVVAAAVEACGVAAMVRTVRPRGHPFDRQLAVGDRLKRAIINSGATHFGIVDEGPGLSGSSFAAAAEALVAWGVSPDRIVIFPSWCASEEALNSPRARDNWRRYIKMMEPFERVWLDSAQLESVPQRLIDFSAGAWRPYVFGESGDRPPAHPQHERRKYLCPAGPTLLKFAGLGRYGREKLERARVLSSAGFHPQPIRIFRGFLEHEWVDGVPVTRRDVMPEAFIDRLAGYLSLVRRVFATSAADDVEELHGMMQANVTEALGDRHAATLEQLAREARRFEEPRVAIDGRMLPHEWIRSDRGWLKVDALDHHADDFFPGCRDIAWDVAGTIVEFQFDARTADHFMGEYARRSGDATIAERAPFYRAAYLAFRLGYATLAAGTLAGSADGDAFNEYRTRYCRSLEELLDRPRPAARH